MGSRSSCAPDPGPDDLGPRAGAKRSRHQGGWYHVSERRRTLLPACIISIVLSTGLLLIEACGQLPRRAVGPNVEATIVTDLRADSPAVAAVEAAIGRSVLTTRPEPAFVIDVEPGHRFSTVRSWRNLILVADLDQEGPTTELVSRTLGREGLADFRSGEQLFAVYGDVWAEGQTVLVVAAPGAETLAAAVRVASDSIYAAFEAQVIRQIPDLLYLAGEQESLRRELADRYGWSLRIPAGYRSGIGADSGFVRFFMREGGARLIFVHWQDGVVALPAADSCVAIRARLAASYYQGDFVDSARTRVEATTFLGHPAHHLVGVWQNDRYTIGGPFRTYCFVDAGRFIMIDLAVFEPIKSKVELLRQLEAIALTFEDHRTRR